MFLAQPFVLFDFKKNIDKNQWVIIDDVVMGGRSSGKFEINEKGNGVFSGTVSLENNGGFSSMFHSLKVTNVQSYKTLVLKVKGDKKRYQFRIKENSEDYFSYIQYFETNGEWETIKLPLKDFYPSFRGRKLNQPNFSGEEINEVRFLIANKKGEAFTLLIDEITLE